MTLNLTRNLPGRCGIVYVLCLIDLNLCHCTVWLTRAPDRSPHCPLSAAPGVSGLLMHWFAIWRCRERIIVHAAARFTFETIAVQLVCMFGAPRFRWFFLSPKFTGEVFSIPCKCVCRQCETRIHIYIVHLNVMHTGFVLASPAVMCWFDVLWAETKLG